MYVAACSYSLATAQSFDADFYTYAKVVILMYMCIVSVTCVVCTYKATAFRC